MKSEILALLKKYQPEYISGEEVSNSLQVSRTAIWKHIQALREDGYEIESQPRTGYRLTKIPDLLYPQEIKNKLATKYVGQQIHFFKTINSTNIMAKELANHGAVNGTIVVTEKQEQGRGRLGRQWISPQGKGIWFSLILTPEISPTEAPKYTILAGVAVAKVINRYIGIKTGIKWPNDILVNEKKVCGILTEMNAEIDKVNYIIVGIGINVNINKSSFPAEIKDIATSLSAESGHKVDRVGLLQEILGELEQLNEQFINGNFNNILAQWRQLSVTINKPVTITMLKEQFTGIAVDIEQDGSLVIQKENGQKTKVFSGEVTLAKKK